MQLPNLKGWSDFKVECIYVFSSHNAVNFRLIFEQYVRKSDLKFALSN